MKMVLDVENSMGTPILVSKMVPKLMMRIQMMTKMELVLLVATLKMQLANRCLGKR